MKKDAAAILGNATRYLGDTYPFIKNDVLRQTPERRACEILLALKDLIELKEWGITYLDDDKRSRLK